MQPLAMRSRFFIILILIWLAVPAGEACARLTLGAVQGKSAGQDIPGQARSLANALADSLEEEVEVRLFDQSAQIGQWLNQFAMLDLGLLDAAYVAAHPGEFLIIGAIDPGGRLVVVTRQGATGDVPRRVADALKRGAAPKPGFRLPEVKAATVAPAPPAIPAPPAFDGQLVLGLVAAPGGVVHDPLQAGQFAAALGERLGVSLRPRLFDNEQTLAEWFRRFGVIDLAVISISERGDPLVGDYRPVLALKRSTTSGVVLDMLVARRNFPGDRFDSLEKDIASYRGSLSVEELLAPPVMAALTEAEVPEPVTPMPPEPPAAVPLPAVAAPAPVLPVLPEPPVVVEPSLEPPVAEPPPMAAAPEPVLPVPAVLPEPPVVPEPPAMPPVVAAPEPVLPVPAVLPEPPVVPELPAMPPVVAAPVPVLPVPPVLPEPPVVPEPPATPPVVAAPAPVLPVPPVLPEAPVVVEPPAVPSVPEPPVVAPLPSVPEIVSQVVDELPQEQVAPRPAAAPDAMLSSSGVTIKSAAMPQSSRTADPVVATENAELSAPVGPVPTTVFASPETVQGESQPVEALPLEALAAVAPGKVKVVPPVAPPVVAPESPSPPARPERSVAVPGPAEAAETVPGLPFVPVPPKIVVEAPAAAVPEPPVVTTLVESLQPVAAVPAVPTPEPATAPEPPGSGENLPVPATSTVPSMIAQPDLPQELRPPGVPLPRPGRVPKAAPPVEEPLLMAKLQAPLARTPKPPPLLPEPDADPGIVYVAPFITLMVPPEVQERVFDQFVDTLNQRGAAQKLKFVILKQGIDKVDRSWLEARKYAVGEIYGYVEDSGCCSTDLRTRVRLTYYRAHQPEPVLKYEYPVRTFFDHDRSNLAAERQKLADQIAGALVDELFKAFQP